ncbi:tryptophan halogenase, partial [mine drainage metagenome]
SGFEDWREWLPCDRAVATTAASAAAVRPFTQATARPAGWQWRIPQQHRSGDGHVYCSEFMSDDEATAILLAGLEGPALSEPRIIRISTGVRRRLWVRNCVAIGLAAGFIEPLESTAIHLAQSGINRLLALFPDAGFDPAIAEEYNRKMREEYEQVRDFVVLHYRATERRDTPFWRHCAALPAPPGLARKLAIFQATGQIFREGEELFTEQSWLQVLLGQGILPKRYHPAADDLPQGQLQEFLDTIRNVIATAVERMPRPRALHRRALRHRAALERAFTWSARRSRRSASRCTRGGSAVRVRSFPVRADPRQVARRVDPGMQVDQRIIAFRPDFLADEYRQPGGVLEQLERLGHDPSAVAEMIDLVL